MEGSEPAVGKERPNILLLCLDAVRGKEVLDPDAAGIEVAPFLQALAERGTVFTQCYASAPWTLPSLGSVFSGLYPSEHGADSYETRFSPSVPTVAEVLRDGEGYETVCVSYNPYLSDRFNLTQGFATRYMYGRRRPRFFLRRRHYRGWKKIAEMARLVLAGGRPARDLVELAAYIVSARASRRGRDHGAARNNEIITRLFARQRERPLFVMASYMEAHWPYYFDRDTALLTEMEAAWVRMAVAEAFPWGLISGRTPLSSEAREHLAALYWSAVRYLDRKVEALWEALQAAGALKNTYLVIFADHGEMLGENGLYAHTMTLHNRVLHVPLLIVSPPGRARPLRVEKRFRLQDVREVILRLAAGEESAAHVYIRDYPEGRPIYAEYSGRHDRLTEADHAYLASSQIPAGGLATLIKSHYKFVRSSGGAEWLFDLVGERGDGRAEERNLVEARPEVAEEMRDELEAFRAELRPAGQPVATDLEEQLEERLRQLGYL